VTSDAAARSVLDQFALGGRVVRLEFLSNHGGFSGARLWRSTAGGTDFCLRAWPTGTPRGLLRLLHPLMASALRQGLNFVPAVCRTTANSTWVEHQGRVWELTSWVPGRADFHARPTPGRLRSACTALARLHEVWRHALGERSPAPGPCPAVARRLRAVEEWRLLLRSGWRPRFGTAERAALNPVAERAWGLLPAAVELLPPLLEPWCGCALPLQPCLCDIWHDHLLYEEDTLTGLVDYGAVKTDQVAVDLARMLGSLVGDDRGQWEVGLKAYREVRPLTPKEEALADVLDRSGTVLGAANWLRWVYYDDRRFDDLWLAAERLAVLVERIPSPQR
jgi:Ser/Thr protein kinase RdoA (MazF antagonist)